MLKSIVFLTVCVVLLALAVSYCNPESIITVPNWEHGVALCEGIDDEPISMKGKAHMWAKNGILYIINGGHLHDKEVEKLVYLAESECAQYFVEGKHLRRRK